MIQPAMHKIYIERGLLTEEESERLVKDAERITACQDNKDQEEPEYDLCEGL